MRALVAIVVAVIMVASGGASSATEDLLSLTNADRSRHGLSSLTIAADLQAYAQGWAEAMMKAGELSHSTDLGAVTNRRVVGENVGQGPTLTNIESAFMASPAHRANILWPDYSEAGVGVVWDGVEYFYVAVVFRQSTMAAAPPPAPVEPDPEPGPVEPDPAPTVSEPAPAPAPPATSSRPAARLPEPTPARFPAMSAPAEVPPPLPSPEPDPAEHPASLEREAGPRLSWVLAATTGRSVSPADGHDGESPTPVIRAASIGSAAKEGSSPALLITVAVLWMVFAWTRILAEAHQWFVSRRPAVDRHH